MLFADLPGVRVHYRVDGDTAAPPLLLCHALGASLDMWEPQMPAFAARYYVVRYDQRGHGRSQAPPGPYSIEMLAQDALDLLDSLSIPAAHFCGLSMGGQVGIWLGVNAPDRLDRLVVANTAPRIGSAELWNARIDAVLSGGTASIAPAVLTRWFSQSLMEQPTPIVARMRAAFEAMSPEAYASACAAVRDTDQRYALRRIHTPTLVIAGSDDASTPPEDTRYIADHVENARFVELQSSHFSNILSAPAFTQAVIRFLSARL